MICLKNAMQKLTNLEGFLEGFLTWPKCKQFLSNFDMFCFFFFARSFNEVGKTGKEERKSKNENTRLRRWGIENLTVLPYLRTYFRGLNAIRKSSFETPHTASCVARTVLDRLCSDAGSSGTLRRKMLLFVVTRFSCCRVLKIEIMNMKLHA